MIASILSTGARCKFSVRYVARYQRHAKGNVKTIVIEARKECVIAAAAVALVLELTRLRARGIFTKSRFECRPLDRRGRKDFALLARFLSRNRSMKPCIERNAGRRDIDCPINNVTIWLREATSTYVAQVLCCIQLRLFEEETTYQFKTGEKCGKEWPFSFLKKTRCVEKMFFRSIFLVIYAYACVCGTSNRRMKGEKSYSEGG